MAANIAKAGFELTVCEILREEPCKKLAALGAPELSHHPGKLRKRAIS